MHLEPRDIRLLEQMNGRFSVKEKQFLLGFSSLIPFQVRAIILFIIALGATCDLAGAQSHDSENKVLSYLLRDHLDRSPRFIVPTANNTQRSKSPTSEPWSLNPPPSNSADSVLDQQTAHGWGTLKPQTSTENINCVPSLKSKNRRLQLSPGIKPLGESIQMASAACRKIHNEEFFRAVVRLSETIFASFFTQNSSTSDRSLSDDFWSAHNPNEDSLIPLWTEDANKMAQKSQATQRTTSKSLEAPLKANHDNDVALVPLNDTNLLAFKFKDTRP